jgi:cytochrome c oxidase subunit 2
MKRRPEPNSRDELVRTPGSTTWIYAGTGLSVIVLVFTFVQTMRVLSAASNPDRRPAITVQVIGHQWWWEIRYSDRGGRNAFTTANEIHVPVGHPVRIELVTRDVIHSFWVPELVGKTDLIPGRTNTTWVEADQPGKFLGICGEYCGLQHAHMQLTVVAEEPAAFRAWWGRQLAPRTAPATRAMADGERVFLSKCSACHQVRGSAAAGSIGPDLTHLMTRETIAAGTLPNSRGNQAGWISNPQGVKPGTKMPAIPLTSAELQSILGYLENLN